MKNKKYAISFILLFFSLLGISMSDASQNNKDEERENRVDIFIKSIMDAYQIPGLAMAIVTDNQIFVTKAYGVKNLNTKEPMTTKSIFHMASVSKPFSAIAIMQLVEKGKMKLGDPLIKYLPYFKLDDSRYKDITIKQMLMHTSGIPDVTDYEWDKPQFDDGAAERYVRSLVNEKMIAGPGEKWQYSNMAFDILADVIAKVSGMTFEDYIKQNILNPLEMTDSDFLRERIKPELRTTAHVSNLQSQVSDVYPYNRRHAPSSCLNANVVEMCNWAIANMNTGAFKENRILDESSYKLLFEPQAKINNNRSVGLSWFIDKYRGMKTISHGGGDLGFRSYIIMLPEKSLAVIAASNFESTPMNNLIFGIIDIMLGFEPQQSKIPIRIIMSKTIAASGVNKAIEQYRELKRLQPENYNFEEAQLNTLGYQLIHHERLEDAIEIFKLNVEMFPEAFNAYDSLAETYMTSGNKELAIENYKKSIELNPKNSNGIKILEKLQKQNFTDLYGDYLGQTPQGDTPGVFARGIVSTDYAEHSAPVFSPDGNEVFWWVVRGPRSDNEEWTHTGMTMRRIGDRWTAPTVSPYDGVPVFSTDGKRLYFGSEGTGNDLYFVEKQDNSWSETKNVGLVARSPELKSASCPSIAHNGTLYFMGDPVGSGMYKDCCIYRSKLVNGEYTKPELLPRCINLPPFWNFTLLIAPDESYLIFASNRHNQDGGGDLYISFHDIGADTWSEPINMGELINTGAQERHPGLSPDGKYFFFTRCTRWSPPDYDHDIFWVSAGIIDKLKAKVVQERRLKTNTPQEDPK